MNTELPPRPTEEEMEEIVRRATMAADATNVHRVNALLGILRSIRGRKNWGMEQTIAWRTFKRDLDATLLHQPLPPRDTGWLIQSRMPIIDKEWELCKMHGHTPPEGLTERDACRIAASLVNMCSADGPEIQWRVLDPSGQEIARESNRRKP